MMEAEFNIVEVHVSFFTYNSMRCSTLPKEEQSDSCIANIGELKLHREFKRSQRHILGPDAYNHYKWYNSMLKSELNFCGENCKLNIIHWDIESGDENIFKINSESYTAVTVIIGCEMEHWYYSNPDINSDIRYGSRLRENKVSFYHTTDILERRKKLLKPEPNPALIALAEHRLHCTMCGNSFDNYVNIGLKTMNMDTSNASSKQEQIKSDKDIQEKYKFLEEIRDRLRKSKIAKLENPILCTIVEEDSCS